MAIHRVLSGMRPTGKLHLGHLHGAIANWIELQDQYDCFFMIADWHALTTAYKSSVDIRRYVREAALDYIACGVDPNRCTLYVQSDIKEIAELHLLLSMTVQVAKLENCPSYKDQIQELGPDIMTYGFLGYPVLMTADIVIFKADAVPVGQDQLPHLELAREIVRRVHHLYGRDIFREPEALLTRFPAVPGLDGRKMSKSYGNDISISEPLANVPKIVRQFITDPQKIRRGDPGHPEICPVFYFQKMYNAAAVPEIEAGCRSGALGCVDCKGRLSARIAETLAPIQERRAALEATPSLIDDILAEGAKKARGVAQETLHELQEAMGLAPAKVRSSHG